MIWTDILSHFNDIPLAPPDLLGMMEARFVRFRYRRYGLKKKNVLKNIKFQESYSRLHFGFFLGPKKIKNYKMNVTFLKLNIFPYVFFLTISTISETHESGVHHAREVRRTEE